MRYQRNSLMSTLNAAIKLAEQDKQHDHYVFATASGFTISHNPPPPTQCYRVVHKDGSRELRGPGYVVHF